MGHRYYDPQQGRFLSRDPLGLAGGMNAYRYADNDPISLIDPSGLSPFSDWYWGGMGGLSNLADQGLMNGSVGNLGTVAGEHDSGCVSDLELAKAGLNVAGNAAMLVIPGGGEAKEANVVYRALAEGELEHISTGLFARAPEALGVDEVSHVAGAEVTPWISTTKDLTNAMARDVDKGYGVAEIDLSKIGTTISDISDGNLPRYAPMFSSWARNSQEVLIKSFIPPDAIRIIHP